MKKRTLIILVAAVLFIMGGTAVYASSLGNYPAEIYANLTGKSIDDAIDQAQTQDKTFGQLATESEVLDEFKNGMLELKKERIQTMVEEGRITQEEADAYIERVVENLEECDGTGTNGIGFGRMSRDGSECGLTGFGKGNRGMGRGFNRAN